MLKFFRRIRQSLLSQNKFSKYLLYALGEIFLVVIGILMALQINNLNEDRKKTAEIESLMQVFENELEENIKSCNSFIEYGYETDSIATLYQNKKITKEMLANNSYLEWGFGTFMQQFIDDNLNELISFEKQLPKRYKGLVPELKELKRRIESQRNWEKKAVDLSLIRFKELTDTLPWMFKSDSISQDIAFDYYISDELYKNKVLHYNTLQLSENVWDATLIRTSSTVLLWKLKNIRAKNNTLDLNEFLASKGLQPFEALNCADRPFERRERISFGRNFIIYNNTDSKVDFNIIKTTGEIVSNGSIDPHSFILDEFGLGTNYLVERIDDTTCKKVYRYVKEDYLIFN